MSSATQPGFVEDSWQTPRNARTLRAFMALRNQEIGARLRELRGERPQTLVAEQLGVAERTYQTWEQGEAKPSYRNLQRAAEYFGVGEDYILKGDRRAGKRADNDGATPSPLPARRESVEDRLARIEEALAEASGEREAISRLLERQSRVIEGIEVLLEQQNRILARLDASVAREEKARRDADESAKRLLAAADDASRVLRDASQRPVEARGKSTT